MSDLANLKPTIRLSIMNPDAESGSLFGRGIASLCLGVRETGSLNAAAKGMGMAYSKAWRIIKDTEAALDLQLLNRDGAHGSDLTEAGNKLLDTVPRHRREAAERSRGAVRSGVQVAPVPLSHSPVSFSGRGSSGRPAGCDSSDRASGGWR